MATTVFYLSSNVSSFVKYCLTAASQHGSRTFPHGHSRQVMTPCQHKRIEDVRTCMYATMPQEPYLFQLVVHQSTREGKVEITTGTSPVFQRTITWNAPRNTRKIGSNGRRRARNFSLRLSPIKAYDRGAVTAATVSLELRVALFV